MKLMYEMPGPDRAAYDAAAAPDEILMYCVPFNIWEERFVSGWTAVTDRAIYSILDGKVLASYELARCTVFSTEVLYGNCAFYGVVDGTTTLISQFLSGRNLPRYSVLVDVLPSWRRQGIAAAVTSRLAREILDRDKVPFYCAAWSNIRSVRNAIKSGFRPAWVELTARDREFVNRFAEKM